MLAHTLSMPVPVEFFSHPAKMRLATGDAHRFDRSATAALPARPSASPQPRQDLPIEHQTLLSGLRQQVAAFERHLHRELGLLIC